MNKHGKPFAELVRSRGHNLADCRLRVLEESLYIYLASHMAKNVPFGWNGFYLSNEELAQQCTQSVEEFGIARFRDIGLDLD